MPKPAPKPDPKPEDEPLHPAIIRIIDALARAQAREDHDFAIKEDVENKS